jgi:hypothetical protein
MKSSLLFAMLLLAGTVCADNRIFTYTYEPETEPGRDWEYEQSVTLRAGRNAAVGQGDYEHWEFRHELEHGVTDRYTAALYLNHAFTYFKDPKHFRADWQSLDGGKIRLQCSKIPSHNHLSNSLLHP